MTQEKKDAIIKEALNRTDELQREGIEAFRLYHQTQLEISRQILREFLVHEKRKILLEAHENAEQLLIGGELLADPDSKIKESGLENEVDMEKLKDAVKTVNEVIRLLQEHK